MRTLFVIHSTNMIYGAAKSLSTVTRSWKNEFDIIFPKDFPRDFLRKNDKASIIAEAKKVYGSKLKAVYFCWLPFAFPLKVDYKNTLKWKVKYMVNYILGLLFRSRVYSMIKAGNYDFVHLNSVILYPFINKKISMFIHIREVVDARGLWTDRICNKLAAAKGVFFIDLAVEAPFRGRLKKKNSIVLNNPFDMRRVDEISVIKEKDNYGIFPDETVYAIIGEVSKIKGILFVINSFKKSRSKSKLLIVGTGNEDFLKNCKQEVEDDARIIFVGELKDVIPIYAISDYVVRGDYCFCIGRTIYEGLYAGTGVLIPGCEADKEKVFDYEKYEKLIHFYEPRNSEALSQLFMSLGSVKRESTNALRSNVDEYLNTFLEFIAAMR